MPAIYVPLILVNHFMSQGVQEPLGAKPFVHESNGAPGSCFLFFVQPVTITPCTSDCAFGYNRSCQHIIEYVFVDDVVGVHNVLVGGTKTLAPLIGYTR